MNKEAIVIFRLIVLFIPLLYTTSTAQVALDGIDDYINIPDHSVNNLGNNDWTIGIFCKVNENSGSGHQGVFSSKWYLVHGAVSFKLYRNGTEWGGHWLVELKDDDGTSVSILSSGTHRDDGIWRWVFLRREKANSRVALYFSDMSADASLELQGTASDVDLDTFTGSDIYLGYKRGSAPEFFNGVIAAFFMKDGDFSCDDCRNIVRSCNKRLMLQYDLNLCFLFDDIAVGQSCDGKIFRDYANGNDATGVDGANNSGLIAVDEEHYSYP